MLSRKRERYRYVGKRHAGGPAYPLNRVVRVEREPARETPAVFVCGDPMVFGAVRYIASNVQKEIQIDDIAGHLNTSRETLIRRFRDTLGRTVKSEVRRQRVDHLKGLLTGTTRAIGEISAANGFSSAGQFSRYFKREVGVSPSDYRRGRIAPADATAYGRA